MERERALSRAGAALVAAGTREELDAVAITAARELAGGDVEVAAARRHDVHRAWTASPRPATRAWSSTSTRARATRRSSLLSGPTVAERAVREVLGALGTQVVLAFERAALTEELARRKSEARFASLVQHSSDLITVLAPDATIAYQSPAIERVLGWTPEDVVGRRIDELMEQGEGSRLLRLIADGVDAPVASQTLECTLAHKDGTTRQFEVLFTNLTRRRACRRHRAELARRQRAQGLRAPARPPGVPRPGHRPAQPRAVRRARAPRDRAVAPRGTRGIGDHLHRPRRLQDHQRLARPRRGRRGALPGRAAPGAVDPRQRHRRALRRRRVRRRCWRTSRASRRRPTPPSASWRPSARR